MRGLPASGKSTRAKELQERGGWVRVNRDLMREMMHYGKYSGKNEGAVVAAEKAVAASALANGLSVIVDDCNLNPNNKTMWSEFAKAHGAKFSVEDMFGKSLPHIVDIKNFCIRDALRQKSVGASVIINMALQYYPEVFDDKYIVCDIDGTVANLQHRLHYIKNEDGTDKDVKDWDGFFSKVYDDSPIDSTIDMLHKYKEEGYEIIFVSARPEKCRQATIEWLMNYVDVDPVTLIMRGDGDKREDSDVKRDIHKKYLANLYIKCIIDDRPRVINMWREEGYHVIDVGPGIDF